jgi:hypothetical protein
MSNSLSTYNRRRGDRSQLSPNAKISKKLIKKGVKKNTHSVKKENVKIPSNTQVENTTNDSITDINTKG